MSTATQRLGTQIYEFAELPEITLDKLAKLAEWIDAEFSGVRTQIHSHRGRLSVWAYSGENEWVGGVTEQRLRQICEAWEIGCVN